MKEDLTDWLINREQSIDYGEKLEKAEARIKELEEDNKEYEIILDVFDEREYRKKYLEERRKEEPRLLYPDADEIYKKYYQQKARIKDLEEINEAHKKENGELREKEADLTTVYLSGVYDGEKKWKDKIKEKIEELNKEADYRTEDNPKGRIHFTPEPCDYQIQVLEELLKEDKTNE